MDSIEKIYTMTQQNIGYDMAYDIFKIVLGFFFAKIVYESIYMKLRWGGWKIKVINGTEELVSRNISPAVAKRIMSDGSDFSVFVKGVISPFFRINKRDMSLERANETKLLIVDKETKIITIDKAHNPPSS